MRPQNKRKWTMLKTSYFFPSDNSFVSWCASYQSTRLKCEISLALVCWVRLNARLACAAHIFRLWSCNECVHLILAEGAGWLSLDVPARFSMICLVSFYYFIWHRVNVESSFILCAPAMMLPWVNRLLLTISSSIFISCILLRMKIYKWAAGRRTTYIHLVDKIG